MRNDKPIRACKACGLAFLALSPKRIYCSAACRKAAEVKRQPRRSACEHCGQAFATKQSRRRFCSPRCQTNAAKKRLYPRRPPREIKCERCGKVFLARGPSVGPARVRFCSTKCQQGFGVKVRKACAECRQRFRTKRSWRIFCSAKCQRRQAARLRRTARRVERRGVE